ncbi:MAG: hypothetical protein QOH61_1205 [Chloroflexota bacterium]|jgi:hypothetical protein|nr:hypothetical protein [Chloroflexota bacterium]
MRRQVLALLVTSLLTCACAGNAPLGTATAGPEGAVTARPSADVTPRGSVAATGPITAPPTGALTPPPTTSTGDVVLHGSFIGHTDDPASTSDATFDVVVIWHRPNDVHDRTNFQFASGSYTFSTSVLGVCGGTRNEGGPLSIWGTDATGLILGDPQDRSHEIHASLIDNRLNQGGIEFALVASFPIPSGAVECQPPYNGYGYVATCPVEFPLATQDSLKPDADCTQGGTTWKGHLVP